MRRPRPHWASAGRAPGPASLPEARERREGGKGEEKTGAAGGAPSATRAALLAPRWYRSCGAGLTLSSHLRRALLSTCRPVSIAYSTTRAVGPSRPLAFFRYPPRPAVCARPCSLESSSAPCTPPLTPRADAGRPPATGLAAAAAAAAEAQGERRRAAAGWPAAAPSFNLHSPAAPDPETPAHTPCLLTPPPGPASTRPRCSRRPRRRPGSRHWRRR